MAENEYTYDEPQVEKKPRRGLDMVTFVFGLLTLMVSGFVLGDGASWLPNFDFRWLMAGVAVFIGLVMLGSSLRSKR
ncbi:hypothetical protein [Amycolatopsis sp. NPDC059657]|uniref:hypothetical protein n=1 Tax=Amycolatopsis sp. NPDC059657 TaxID=3346899 RepID=UPI00366EFB02